MKIIVRLCKKIEEKIDTYSIQKKLILLYVCLCGPAGRPDRQCCSRNDIFGGTQCKKTGDRKYSECGRVQH